jgi:ABC-type transport system substrate-binding protein
MKRLVSLLLAGTMVLSMAACGSSSETTTATTTTDEATTSTAAATETETSTTTDTLDTSKFLLIADDNPDQTDPQCTSEYYTVGMNVFDRLVEVKANGDGTSEIVPSLAKSWDISDDGLEYTFYLEEGVKYSNGADMTASDVLYSFTRLLTYEKAVNDDVVDMILGAEELMNGEADTLEGFEIIDDYTIKITLTQPYAAFLAGLTTPGASILDEETTEAAGDQFGIDPAVTIGTGPFIFYSWTFNDQLILVANKDCWSGAPASEGIVMKFIEDQDTMRMMFENGELDILDLDNAASQVDYFLDNPDYADNIVSGMRVGIYYIAMNEAFEPLDNVLVRKALQRGVDRQAILDALFGGRGEVLSGILPIGLIGYNADLPDIEYDPEEAKALLAEAGYPDGFDLTFNISSEASSTTKDLVEIVAAQWGEIGVNVTIETLDDATMMDLRRSGQIMCYTSSWSADFNDPDNFLYTFFGTTDNTVLRSLNYANTDAIARVAAARGIVDEDERVAEYQALEELIIQEDAAWVPLFAKEHLFVVNPRVTGFTVSWNGWTNNYYRNVAVN